MPPTPSQVAQQPVRPAPQPPVQPTPPAANQSVQTAGAKPAPAEGTGFLQGSVSIRIKPVEAPQRLIKAEEALPLTQERLQEGWNKLLEAWSQSHPDWVITLQGREVKRVGDTSFLIVASNSVFERELRLFQVPMLEFLRNALQCPELVCSVEVQVDTSQENKAYQPAEKYREMVKINPELEKLRMLFGEIDY